MSQGSKFDGGRELELLTQQNPIFGSLVKKLIDALNRTADNAAVGVNGDAPAPPPVDTTTIAGTFDSTTNTTTVNGEILHWTHTHNSPLQRGIHYITEIDTDPSFPNPHQIDSGASRSGFHPIPAMNDDGDPVDYYVRVTPQYRGSAPGTPTVYGGLQGPTKVNFTGSSQITLNSSQAAGTARPGQGGKGLGPVQARPAVGGPKRTLPQK